MKDRSDFFTAMVKASRLLMGNDIEQPGHLVYFTDGRLVMPNFQVVFLIMLQSCSSGYKLFFQPHGPESKRYIQQDE